jgi:ankyrin repeat protein
LRGCGPQGHRRAVSHRSADHINDLGRTALLEAIILGNGGERHRQIVDMLLKAGANPDLADSEGATPLEHARSRGYREIERSLLAAGGR